MTKVTEETRLEAKRMFEDLGMTKAAISRDLGVSSQAIAKWSKKYEWGPQGKARSTPYTGPPAVEPEAATVGSPADYNFSAASDTTAPPTSTVELEAQIIALEAERNQLAAENARLKPTVDVREMITDRVAWLTTNTSEGDRYWINRAEAEFKKTNQQRIADNLPPFDLKDYPDMLEETITTLKAKEAQLHDREPVEPPSRKIKLAIERNGVLTIEQIPLEGQINNTAGSLADGIVRYTRKGFRITDPFLCPRAGCFRPASVDEFNRWSWGGYCSEKHHKEVEVDQDVDLAGVVIRDHGVLSGTG